MIFFHGDWDTSTPIENTLGMLPYFPNGRALLVHRGAHHTRAPVFEQQPEILEQVIAFLKTGVTRNFPVNVSLPVPMFRRPSFRPTQSEAKQRLELDGVTFQELETR